MIPKSEKLKLLDVLVPQYALNKAEMDSYTKICKRENAQIKDIMTDLALQHYTSEDIKVTCSVSQREKLDEDILLDIFNKNVSTNLGIVKTKEYIDFDALESAIYKGLIPENILLEMDKAREVKEVVTLKVGKVKKKKEEEE